MNEIDDIKKGVKNLDSTLGKGSTFTLLIPEGDKIKVKGVRNS